MSSIGQLESKVETLNFSSVEEQNKELCKEQQQQQQLETSPLCTHKMNTNYQKELERQSDNENSLPTFDKVLPSEMQSIQMLESANVTSVEKHHHHNQQHSINDKSDVEEMWFSNLEEHTNAEEQSHPPVNHNEHTLLLSHIRTLTNNVHWLKEELRETQRQLLQSWGRYITQQEEMKILQTRIDDLERKMEEQRSHVTSCNITSQSKRVKNTKMLYGQQYTQNSTILQNSNNKTKQTNTMTQMRCENNTSNIINKNNNINNCSCFVTKLRNGVSGFDVYGRSLAHKRSHTTKKNAIDNNSNNNHYNNMQNGKFESKCTYEKGKTNRHNVQLQQVYSNRKQSNNGNNYKNSSKKMKISQQAIVKKRINASPELLLTGERNCEHSVQSEYLERWEEQEQEEQQRYNNPEISNGATDRERSNIQDSSVPSDGSNTVWVSSIRRVSSAYIEHNNLSSFTNGFFVACDENDSNGELRQIIGPHVKYISNNNNNNEMEKNNKEIHLDELNKSEEKYYKKGRESTSPFLIAVDSNDGNSISLEQQHCECEQNAWNRSSKLEGKNLQEMEINKTTISAADAQRACSKMQPLTNITNILPKCSSCLSTKMYTAYDKCNNTFQCQRIIDLKSKNNNNKSDKYLCEVKKHDNENLHTTLPLLHHTHSVLFDTARH